MSKWLRRGFGGNGTPTSGGSNRPASPRSVPQDAGMTHPSSNPSTNPPQSQAPFPGRMSEVASPAADANVAPPPNYESQTPQQNRAPKSRSDRTSASSTNGYNGNPEESVPVHPPKPSQRRSTQDPSKRSSRSVRHPETGNAQTGEAAQPPAPGSTQINYDYGPSAGGAANAFSPPGGNDAGSREVMDFSSSTGGASNPQGGSTTAPRRPAYLLHRDLVIGKGSYGQVCIASRGESEGGRSGKRKKFACKCVMLRSDPKYIAKLQEEVNVLRELRGHDNVIRLYDVFCVDNELFIITELGRGGDLFHLLTTHPKHGVTESYAAKTVAQMLSSVAFLHSRNICHRDLKLENWVLESGKDVWSPLKLIDFGLSTHFTPGHRLSRVVGSSYYVAPEVLKKSYTEACDLWSLGVIVYMLLSGAPPFYGRTDEAIKASIINGEYTFPHELFRDVSDDAMAFVATLLSYNVEYRYTAEQALGHPWLMNNCDPEIYQRAKDGAFVKQHSEKNMDGQFEPMQM
jgi:calcium/calmodulin-dependent protein kinase I